MEDGSGSEEEADGFGVCGGERRGGLPAEAAAGMAWLRAAEAL
jgi:hypothetical protein